MNDFDAARRAADAKGELAMEDLLDSFLVELEGADDDDSLTPALVVATQAIKMVEEMPLAASVWIVIARGLLEDRTTVAEFRRNIGTTRGKLASRG